MNDKNEQLERLIEGLYMLIDYLSQQQDTAQSTEPDDTQPVVMLTIPEVMNLNTGISAHTLRKLIAKGEIYAIRTGEGKRGKYLVSKSSLYSYLNGKAS